MGINGRCTLLNVIKGRYTNLTGWTREPDNDNQKGVTDETTSFSGIEIILSATRRHCEPLTVK
jgi:hypothetical protein